MKNQGNMAENPRENGTIVTGGIKRPAWICGNVKQAAIQVRDCSGSMTGEKAKEAAAASMDLNTELADPANKDGFLVALIDFDSSAEIVQDLTPATKLAGQDIPLDIGRFGGSTNITSGLEKALDIVNRVENSPEEHLKTVVIIFTDGDHNTGPSPEQVAEQLKKKADIVAIAFGSDADEGLLKRLASTPQHFYRCKSGGKELRAFFAAVGATMTATRTRGQNATEALRQISLG